MIQIRLIIFGVTVVASVGYAIYKHYQTYKQPQQHSYDRPTAERDINLQNRPSASSSSRSEQPRNRRGIPARDTSCSICLNNFDSLVPTRNLTCGHTFHENCIVAWFNSSETCPNCRAFAQGN